MNSADVLHRTLQRQCDDRGYVRATLDNLALDSGLSRSTVQRALTHLVTCGLIKHRHKDGRSGGLLIRLETCSKRGQETCSKPVQNDHSGHVVNKTPGPEGAMGGFVGDTKPVQSDHSRPAAYRQARPDEVPVSGAELVYTGDTSDGKWRRISATFWEAPNGDTVSVRSMSLALRTMLRVDENDDGTRNVEAVRAIRGIVE